MGRHPQPEIRQQLLAACTDALLASGLTDLTLRRLAAAAGTSARMLVYHFGTRDALVAEAIREARERQVGLLAPLFETHEGASYPQVLDRAWDVLTGPKARPYMRLFQQLHDWPGQTWWPEFAVHEITDWVPTVHAALAAEGYGDAEALATALIGTLRGLLSDLEATGELDRTTAAWNAVTHLLTQYHQ